MGNLYLEKYLFIPNIDMAAIYDIIETMKKYFFIRDDDVYKYEKGFIDIFNFFKTQKIPIIYGVVPKLIEKRLVDLLNREKEKYPELLDIALHGWSHKNYSCNYNKKFEFGDSRTYRQQKHDILNSYKTMVKLFGRNFTPAFIPPYHGYNQDTLRIIRELNIPVFSAGKKVRILKLNKSFIDLPAQISLNIYKKNQKAIVLKVREAIKKILNSLAENRNLQGILFHHNTITNDELFKELKEFFLFLKKLKNAQKIDIILFSQLICSVSH